MVPRRRWCWWLAGVVTCGTASVVLVAGHLQLGCLLRSRPWSLKPAVVSGCSAHPGLAAPSCNGAVVPRRRTVTQAVESVKMETTAGVRQQSGFICSAADNFQHTQNPHSHAWIRERRGPQGTHAIATIKSALWTTKWLTIVFPWPAQIQFPQQ